MSAQMSLAGLAADVHLCHAKGCEVAVDPKMLMCAPHWRMVPAPLKQAVWFAYLPGQEITKDPTPYYLDVARAAINEVARQEGLR